MRCVQAFGVDDGSGTIGPDECRSVLIPTGNVGGDVVAQLLYAQELGCAQGLLRENAEGAFDLIEPGSARRRSGP